MSVKFRVCLCESPNCFYCKEFMSDEIKLKKDRIMDIIIPDICDKMKVKICKLSEELENLNASYRDFIRFSVLQCNCGYSKHISDIVLYENFWWEEPSHYGMGCWHFHNYTIKCDGCNKTFIIEIPDNISKSSFKEVINNKDN